MSAPGRFDLILVGGGLANGLIAWRLAERRPELRLLILEREPWLGGEHTWSFHDDDLTAAQREWIAPFVACRWPAYDVAFAGLTRRLAGGYASISSARFHATLMARLDSRIRLGAPVRAIAPDAVDLADGTRLTAGAAIDGRGPRRSRHLALGYQKFVGQEVVLAEPHGLTAPVIMDATVAQTDGYRFVYLLPFAPNRLLIEDTYYAEGDALDAAVIRRRIAAYAAARGWTVARALREETGVLPIVLAGDPRALWDEMAGVPHVGLAAGLFHPTTGYSLPEAARLADMIAELPDLAAPALFAAIRQHALRRWRDGRFFRLLNRMLFLAAEPAERHKVLRRFYTLPEPLIRRFYAGRPTVADKLRILSGRPPVPVGRALRALAASDLHRRYGMSGVA